MKNFPCIESTLDITHKGLNVRLWINETLVTEVVDSKLISDIIDYIDNNKYQRGTFIKHFAEIPNINAVQIRDHLHGIENRVMNKVQAGLVAYTVDFAGDVHG